MIRHPIPLITACLKQFGADTDHEFTKHHISVLQTGNYCRPDLTARWIGKSEPEVESVLRSGPEDFLRTPSPCQYLAIFA